MSSSEDLTCETPPGPAPPFPEHRQARDKSPHPNDREPSLGLSIGASGGGGGSGTCGHSISSSMALHYNEDGSSDLDFHGGASTSSTANSLSHHPHHHNQQVTMPLVTTTAEHPHQHPHQHHSCPLDDEKRVRQPILSQLAVASSSASSSSSTSNSGLPSRGNNGNKPTTSGHIASSSSTNHPHPSHSQSHAHSHSHHHQVLHVLDIADVIEDAIEESTDRGERLRISSSRHHRRTERAPTFGSDESSNSDTDSVDNSYLVQYMTQEPIVIRGNGNLTLFGLSNGFATQFPGTLLGRVSKEEFEATINRINDLLRVHQSNNAKFLLLGCLCCCCSFGCSLLLPSLSLSKRTRNSLEKLIAHENNRLYHKLNLNWRLAKQTSHSNHAFMEYILLVEFIPKYNIFQPD